MSNCSGLLSRLARLLRDINVMATKATSKTPSTTPNTIPTICPAFKPDGGVSSIIVVLTGAIVVLGDERGGFVQLGGVVPVGTGGLVRVPRLVVGVEVEVDVDVLVGVVLLVLGGVRRVVGVVLMVGCVLGGVADPDGVVKSGSVATSTVAI